jgi:hypothetical protein
MLSISGLGDCCGADRQDAVRWLPKWSGRFPSYSLLNVTFGSSELFYLHNTSRRS